MKVPRKDLSIIDSGFGWNHDVNPGVVDTIMRCPNGHISSLRDHEIKPDGTVVPSAQCPKCDFHENVILENYTPHPAK